MLLLSLIHIFVILCDKDTSEDFGNAYGVSFIYSGGFKIQMEKDQVDGIRLVCGLDDEEFLWKLAPGETFVTPEAALSYSEKGLTALSDQFQKADVYKRQRRYRSFLSGTPDLYPYADVPQKIRRWRKYLERPGALHA